MRIRLLLLSICGTVVETSHSAVVSVQGPREDTGFMSDTNPGIAMVERIYNLCHQAYPKTKVMVSGIRKPEGALPPRCQAFQFTIYAKT